MKFLKLLFIRHAQSVGNQQKRMQGQAEFELSAEGKQQAEKLAQRLLTEGWRPSYVYTSPLKRAVQTTEILLSCFLAEPLPTHISDLVDGEVDTPLAELMDSAIKTNYLSDTGIDSQVNLKVKQDGALNSNPWTNNNPQRNEDKDIPQSAILNSPISVPQFPPVQIFQTRKGNITVEYARELQEHQNGIFQGLTWAEARAQYPDLCHALESSPDWIPVPEAESLQTARDRSHQFIQHLLNRHTDGEQIWIITHSWIVQHLISELMGCDRSWRLHVHNTALFEFWIDRSRWQCTDQNRFNTDLWQIRRFNDYQHLNNA